MEASLREGVLYVPGVFCFQPDEKGFVPSNHLRLCFGNVLAEQVEPGIEKLAEVFSGIAERAGIGDADAIETERRGFAHERGL
jgi:DNA-binding transcriptional MocR family regulator